MEQHTAYCGLECNNCIIHLAGIEPDSIKRTAMLDEIISIYKL